MAAGKVWLVGAGPGDIVNKRCLAVMLPQIGYNERPLYRTG